MILSCHRICLQGHQKTLVLQWTSLDDYIFFSGLLNQEKPAVEKQKTMYIVTEVANRLSSQGASAIQLISSLNSRLQQEQQLQDGILPLTLQHCRSGPLIMGLRAEL
jgi:hypothetical protein